MFMSGFRRAGALLLTLGPTMVLASTVSITPSMTTVSVGDTFSLSVVGTGFDPALDAGGLDIVWNPAILELGPGAYTRAGGFIAPSNNGTPGIGSVVDIFFFADPARSGSFSIGSIEFHAIGAGTTTVQLAESQLNPFAGGGAPLAVTLEDGTVNVNGSGAVPEPQTWLLFAEGAAVLAWRGRKRLS